MLEIDAERKRVMVLRKAIINMQIALDNAIDYLNEVEEELFTQVELEQIRRLK